MLARCMRLVLCLCVLRDVLQQSISRKYVQSVEYLDMCPQSSLRIRSQCSIMFCWLVLVFAHCCFAHCHTSNSVSHFTKFVSPQLVLVTPSWVVHWLVVSGLGCSWGDGSVLPGIGGRLVCRGSFNSQCLYVSDMVCLTMPCFSCSVVCFLLFHRIRRIAFLDVLRFFRPAPYFTCPALFTCAVCPAFAYAWHVPPCPSVCGICVLFPEYCRSGY